ncbi:DUF952 domain-containing protein [Plantactinospora siamensis]|uniref:DUF952 domain-containing protein n=1 Tax=Plantactinospora siamensis TaxID=555372 RepID=A0ABV6NTC1_9ACTN
MSSERGGEPVYKLLAAAEWAAARAAGRYDGSAVDRRDGFVHFSTAGQLVETAARHFTGQTSLVLLAVDPDRLGAALRWEPSRGGALFPHLYGPMPLAAVLDERPVPEDVPVADAVAALLDRPR